MRPGGGRRRHLVSSHEESAVLIVGAADGFLAALEPAFVRHSVFAETSDLHSLVDSVVAAAPDLVLLCGEAAKDGGQAALEFLSSSPLSSVTPVVILGDEVALDERLNAFRHGAAAVIPRTASVDAIAERIAKLAREIPERGGAALGEIGEATLEEFVSALKSELRSGILSVHTPGSEEEAVRLVLGAGRPLSDVIDEFVTRVRRHVVIAEPLRYEFDERAGGTVQLLGSSEASRKGDQADVHGLRIVLADDDTARADAVTQDLRAHGVTVVVTDLEPNDVRFARLRQIDPAILLIGAKQAQGAGYELMRRMRRDTRLRWSALLVVHWDEVWTEHSPVPAVERILGTLATLGEPERAARDRADSGMPFDTRLEIMGPARLLRALGESKAKIRVSVVNPRVTIDLDISDGLMVGATALTIEDGRRLEGPAALAAMLLLSSGRVHIEPAENPAAANIMATLDVALNLADAEPAPIAPSLPIPAAMMGSRRPPPHDRPQQSLGQRLKNDFSESGRDLVRGRGPAGMPAVVLAGFVALQVAALAAGVLAFAGSQGILSASAEPRPRLAANATETPGAPPNTPAAQSNAPGAVGPATTAAKQVALATKPISKPLLGLEKAPTCEKLLGKRPPIPGSYPGAAHNELRGARKALVRGDLDEAQRCYCRSARYDKRLVEAHTGLARLLLIRRDPEAAAEWARKAAQLEPQNDDIQAILGDALALSGDAVGARTALLASAGMNTNDEPSAVNYSRRMLQLGHMSLKNRDHANAERYFRRAAALDPRNWEGPYGIARSLLELEKSRLAVAYAKQATELGPEISRTYVLLGDVLTASGDAPGAEAAWRKAVDIDPTDTEAKFRVGKLASK